MIPDITVHAYPLINLSAAERAVLLELTLEQGTMRRLLGKYLDHQNALVVLARESNRIVGWGLISPGRNYHELNVFISPLYRRNGIASDIVAAALQFYKPLLVSAGTDEAARLYYKFKEDLLIDDRWSGRLTTRVEQFGWKP